MVGNINLLNLPVIIECIKCLTKTLLMSTHNVCFYGELEKIIHQILFLNKFSWSVTKKH